MMNDVLRANAREQEEEGMLSSLDLEHYTENTSKQHLEHSFILVTKIPDFAGVKVFNRDQTIAWSDVNELIGTKQMHHIKALGEALLDDVPRVFNPSLTGPNGNNLIAFYIPFRLGAESSPVAGVVSVYCSSAMIDAAIQEGVQLLWLVTGLGGIILYVALYRLFVTVYRDRNNIGSKFEKLSADSKHLIQMEKLSAMGQMVTEIAHQLNNPLVGVINLAELAEREIGNQARVKELLGQVRTAGEHCREYVQRMLGLSQLARSETQVTDLGRLVQETVVFFQQSLGPRPVATFEAPAEPISCEVDPVLIRNALFNLIHNAAQADPNGPILVSLTREQRDGKFGYSLAVSDRGSGIPPGAADKLFTPFFTTRSDGTGLGLSIVQQIAVLHGGTISAENRSDGGSRFTIWIPANRDDT
jgi:signal transduction histidine kinase